MTQAVELPLPSRSARASETRLVGVVCFAHFVSHIYIMLLAPVFIFVREDFGLSYTELGLALTAFSITSTLFQTPMGFLVDRVNPRLVLIAGLLLEACAIAVAGIVDSFWVFVAMFAVAGLGNTSYHPADYSLLSQHVAPERMGRVFSFHTFAGMVGNAAGPACLVLVQAVAGWRVGFLVAASLGLIAALIVALMGEPEPATIPAKPRKSDTADAPLEGWKLLLSGPILLNLLFFVLLSFCGGGLNNYLVVTLGALHGTPFTVANTALTTQLSFSAFGVLAGGMLTGLVSRPAAIAAGGLVVTATVCVLVALFDFSAYILVPLMAAAGFFAGITMPSRDLIVRAATPPGAYGRVFGFVSTGFNIAGIVSPTIFGQLLDHGHPRAIFLFMAVCALLSIATVFVNTSRKRAA
ncbi:MAG: transporter, family, fosmidomycin resistance protein [Alphaproteobacteria bacterium]|jgi:MFS family permease|nr:transporter, family, fosmidomycin resistance protein [Alphaproteobacteria bacterium]